MSEFAGQGNGPEESARSARVADSTNDVLKVTAANKNQALSLARVICGR